MSSHKRKSRSQMPRRRIKRRIVRAIRRPIRGVFEFNSKSFDSQFAIIHEKINGLQDLFKTRSDEQDGVLEEIRAQTTKTNGTVTNLTGRVTGIEDLGLNTRLSKIEIRGRFFAGWIAGLSAAIGVATTAGALIIKYWPFH